MHLYISSCHSVGRVTQSVERLATGWTVRGSNHGGEARFCAPAQTVPGAHPASCTMGTGFFQGVKSGWGVTLTPHPLLVPWSRKGRAIPLLPLWAVRPVQSLSACTRVHFTFTFTCPLSFTVTFGLSLSFSLFALKRELKIAHQIYWLSDLWSNEAFQCGISSMQYDSV